MGFIPTTEHKISCIEKNNFRSLEGGKGTSLSLGAVTSRFPGSGIRNKKMLGKAQVGLIKHVGIKY